MTQVAVSKLIINVVSQLTDGILRVCQKELRQKPLVGRGSSFEEKWHRPRSNDDDRRRSSSLELFNSKASAIDLRGTSREITIDLRELARLFEVNAKAN
jgi:hypothetical protein